MQKERSIEGTEADAVSPIQSLLDAMARALTEGRGSDVAKAWETPAYVVSDEGVHPIGSAKEIADFFGGARAQYDERGITGTYAQIENERWLTERIVEVDVRWPYLDDRNEEIGHEISTYVLRRDDFGAMRIRCAIMHGEGASR